MAQNITLLGASYLAVPSVQLPKTGGGTASFTDVSDTTAVASDVATGKYFYTAAGVRTEGTSAGSGDVVITDTTDAAGGTIRTITTTDEITLGSLSVTSNGTYTAPSGTAYNEVAVSVSGGGGGATNVVTGTFNYDSTYSGTAQDISLNYTGSGYPIAMLIFTAEGGYNPNGTAYNTIWRLGTVMHMMVKRVIDNTPPSYSATSVEDAAAVTIRYKSSSTTPNTLTTSAGTANYVYNVTGASVTYPATTAVFKTNKTLSIYVADTSYGFIPGIEYKYIVYYTS